MYLNFLCLYTHAPYIHVARGALKRLDPFVTQGAGRRVEEIRIFRIAFFGLMYLRQKDFRVFNRLDCSGCAERDVGSKLAKVTGGGENNEMAADTSDLVLSL